MGIDDTLRLLDELHPDDDRVCVHCLRPVDRPTYFALDYACEPCADHSTDYPLQTTHGLGYAP